MTQKIKKILIFGNMGVGNLIMYIPTLKGLKNYFQNSEFFMTVYPKHIQTFTSLFKLVGLNFKLIPFRGKYATPIERLNYIVKLHQEKFDMFVKNFLIGVNFILGIPKIPYRLGHISSPNFCMRGDRMINYPVKMGENEHEIIRNLRLLERVTPKKETKKLELKVRFEIGEKVKKKVEKMMNWSGKMVTVGIAGKESKWKELDKKKLQEIIYQLSKISKVVIVGNGEEGREWEEKKNANVINLLNKTSIIETMEVIRRSQVVLTYDGGISWLAQGVGTPVVVIFGPTDYTRVKPVNDSDKMIIGKTPCSPCYRTPKDIKKARGCKNKECLNNIEIEKIIHTVQTYL